MAASCPIAADRIDPAQSLVKVVTVVVALPATSVTVMVSRIVDAQMMLFGIVLVGTDDHQGLGPVVIARIVPQAPAVKPVPLKQVRRCPTRSRARARR